MRIAMTSLLVLLVAAPQAGAGAAEPTAAPSIRVGPGEHLTVVGTGFRPRTLVRVRVTGPGVDRSRTVRAGSRGGIAAVFRLARCDADAVTATAPGGVRARVPKAWFVRECPPPPPLQPGTGTG